MERASTSTTLASSEKSAGMGWEGSKKPTAAPV
jgi:hypothetical protein